MFQLRTKLANSQEGFEAQVESFLKKYKFPLTDEYRKLFAASIQLSDQSEDSFDGKAIAKAIRKAKVSEYAFYVIHPEKRPKPEEAANDEPVQVAAVSEAK